MKYLYIADLSVYMFIRGATFFIFFWIKSTLKPQHSMTTYPIREYYRYIPPHQEFYFFFIVGIFTPLSSTLLHLAFPQSSLPGLYFSRKPKYHTLYSWKIKVNFSCLCSMKVQSAEKNKCLACVCVRQNNANRYLNY